MSDGRKSNTADTERLVKASQVGEREAFDELVRLYQRRAMHVAVRVLGGAEAAADAVQTGFVKAYLSIGKLKEPKQFEFWLLRIVANAAISQLRAAKSRAERIKVSGYNKNEETFSPLDREGGEELKDAIQTAMAKLSKREAKAIALFGLEGLSHRQVAEIMDCSVEAVRWHVFNARKKLKVLLKEYLE